MRKGNDRVVSAQARANWRAARNDNSAELDELRAAVNETARVARSNLLFLLIVGLYLGILVAQTDDMLLLKAGNVDLPIMQVGIPVVTLYAVAPVLFLLLHFNLILRLGQLTTALGLLRDRLEPLPPAEQLRQRVMVYPFDFARLVLGYRDWRTTRRLVFTVVVMLVVVLPLALLLSIQMRFLAYQNETVTLAHQVVVTLDLLVLVTFAAYLARTLGDRQSWPAWHWHVRGRAVGATWPAALVFMFVWTVAIVPESAVERTIGLRSVSAVVFGDWWVHRADFQPTEIEFAILPFRRFLDVRGQKIAANEPLPEEIGGLRAKGEDPDLAWDSVDELDLTGRTLRHGRFSLSRFNRAALGSAILSGAELWGAQLNGADLTGAILNGADLSDAELRGASLFGAELPGADLSYAELHGAVLDNANLVAANMSHSALYGASLQAATLQGAVLESSALFAADLSATELRFVDFRSATWVRPLDWVEVEQGIRSSFELSAWSAQSSRWREAIEERANEPFSLVMPHNRRSKYMCIWHDAMGPFQSWPEPLRICEEQFAEFVVDVACRDSWTAITFLRSYFAPQLLDWTNSSSAPLEEVLHSLETHVGTCPLVDAYVAAARRLVERYK